MVWCDKDIAPSCVMLKLPEEEQLLAGSCLIGISAAALACSDMSSSFLAMSSIAMWSCALTSSVLACTHGPLSFSEGRSFMTSPAQCCQQGDFSFPAGFFVHVWNRSLTTCTTQSRWQLFVPRQPCPASLWFLPDGQWQSAPQYCLVPSNLFSFPSCFTEFLPNSTVLLFSLPNKVMGLFAWFY